MWATSRLSLLRHGVTLRVEMTTEVLVNDFAIRSFRDQGDADYIAARMACRAALVTPFLWQSQQTVEKYLKCILLLNRIEARNVRHDLETAVAAIEQSGKIVIDLTQRTKEFIRHLDDIGRFRYLEISHYAFGAQLVYLDRAAWELRRYCTLSELPRQSKLVNGQRAPRVRIIGGHIEKILDAPNDPARGPLVWQNAFLGSRQRRFIKLRGWMKSSNAPLYLHPEILDEVLKYVYLPKDIVNAYRAHRRP